MTRLLQQGIEAVKELPPERQDMAGEPTIATHEPKFGLRPEQIEDLKRSIAEADERTFANEKEVTETWNQLRL
jgi:hypothetical protein